MLISLKKMRLISIFLLPKGAQLLFRQLQKLSASKIAALKCKSQKNKKLGTMIPPLMHLKGHWTSITSSPNFFPKKVGTYVPLEVLIWVMIVYWVFHSRLSYFEKIWIFLAFSIFQSRLQYKIHNTAASGTLLFIKYLKMKMHWQNQLEMLVLV